MHKKFATILGVMLLLSIPVIATVGFVYSSALTDGVQQVFAFGDAGGGDNGGDAGGGDGAGDAGGGDNGGDAGGGDNSDGDAGGGDNPDGPGDAGGGIEPPTSPSILPPPVVDIVGSYPRGTDWQQGPITITKGDTVALGWVSSFADQCVVVSSPNIGSWTGLTQGSNPPVVGPQVDTVFTITCTNTVGSATDTLIIKPITPAPVCVAPTISLVGSTSATVGVNAPFSYNVGASVNTTGTSPVNLSVSNLPQGLIFNGGIISGTPTQTGTFNILISATNNCGNQSKTFTLTVTAPVCIPPTLPNFANVEISINQPFELPVASTGGTNPVAVTVTGLPNGLSFFNGKIQGTPTQSGVFEASVKAKNNCGEIIKKIKITVVVPVCVPGVPSITSILSKGGEVGESLSYQIISTNSPTSYSATGLPPGFSISGNTISGVPLQEGTFNVTIRVQNNCGNDTEILIITIEKEPPQVCVAPAPIFTSGNATGKVGQYFEYTFTFTNGDSINLFRVNGVIPDGLTHQGDRIWGVPQKAGTFTLEAIAEYDCGEVRKTITITIEDGEIPPPPPSGPVCTLTASKTSILKGESTNLKWTSERAQSVYFTPSIGSSALSGIKTVSPSVTTTYKGTFTGSGGSTVKCQVTIYVNDIPEIPACPFVEDPENYIVTFTGDNVVANGSEADAQTPVVSTSIPAGVYKVKLASYDNHSGKPNQNQPKEQWYLRLMKSDHTILSQSLSISDLPDGEDLIVEKVQDNFVLSHQASKALAAHTHYPDSNPNSITPICAELIPVPPQQCVPGIPSVTSAGYASGVVGQSFSYTITSDKDVTSVTANPLPPGITKNGNVLSGVFTQAGTYNVTIKVFNECGYDTKILTIKVTAPQCELPAPVINNEDLDVEGTIGVSFSYEIETSGVVSQISVDDLPGGLSLVGNKIQGVPTESGTFHVYISASNACGADMKTVKITIHGSSVCTPGIPVINSATSLAGTVGVPLVYTITALNNPTDFSVSTSNLPPGLVFSGNVISGIPTATGTFTVTLEAENHCGKGPAEVVIVITTPGGQCTVPTPTITSPDSATGTVGSDFSYQIAISGTANSYSVTNLPGGLSLNTTTGLISGVPNQTGTFNVTLSAVNQCGTASKNAVITITGGGGGCTSGCGGGGGGFPPNVTLTRATSTPLASAIISLSQVPYTGFGDVFGTIAFMIIVLLASIALAYMSIYRENPIKVVAMITPFVGNIRSKLTSIISPATYTITSKWDDYVESVESVATVSPVKEVSDAWQEVATPVVPVQETINKMISRDFDNRKEENVTEDIAKSLSSMQSDRLRSREVSEVSDKTISEVSLDREIESIAREEGILLSEGVSALILTAADQDLLKARQVLRELSEVAREWYGTSTDSYLVLTSDKARKILFSTYVSMIPLFIKWIAEGESKKIFGLLRILNQQGHSIADFVGKIVAELDSVYRFKTEGVGNPDRFALEVTNSWKRGVLEAVISSLVSGVDESYGSQYVAAKLALTKALDISRLEREEKI